MTTSPQDQARLNDALDDLTDALEAHLAACIDSTGEADVAVQGAYSALREAASRYDDILFTLLDEVTPWEFAEGPQVDEGEEIDERLATIALLLRRDYTIADDDVLLAAARQAYAELYPDDTDEAAVSDVNSVARALYQLFHAYGVDGLDQRAELAGLVPRGGTVWMQEIDDDAASSLIEDPFGVADEHAVVYRLDEMRVDEAE